MTIGISICPSKDLRTNYGQLSALTRQNPVAITVNGREDTVGDDNVYIKAAFNAKLVISAS